VHHRALEMFMSYETSLIKHAGPVATVTFNREKRQGKFHNR
jgi:hypothetical protein